MSDLPLRLPLAITALTVAAGVLDSLAFTYSASIWQGGRLSWLAVAKSGGAFALGIVFYWLSLRYLREAGVVLPEIQTLIWFSVTIVGVTALSGRFASWPLADQVAGVSALASLGWLIVRTSG